VTPRRTFRSEAPGPTIEAALDLALERLERQISTYRSKREARLTRPASHTIPAGTNGGIRAFDVGPAENGPDSALD